MVHVSWYMVHCTRFMVHGTWYTIHGTLYMVHGIWYMVHDTRYKVFLRHPCTPVQTAYKKPEMAIKKRKYDQSISGYFQDVREIDKQKNAETY